VILFTNKQTDEQRPKVLMQHTSCKFSCRELQACNYVRLVGVVIC